MTPMDPSETPKSRMNTALLMGAASPLWTYFGAATASGLAFWWMTRWTRPANLEAMFAAETPEFPALDAVEAVAEEVAETSAALLAETIPEPLPTSDATAAQIIAASDPGEPAASVAEPETGVEAVADAALEPGRDPDAAPVSEDIAAVEAASPDEPAAKSRPRKTAPSRADAET